jgi:uncharacterized membrane protein HdeD (DUF308 family)
MHMAQEAGLVPHHWWAFALRGVVAIVFGILAFAWPGLTLATLIFLFGAFAIINGIMAIISAIRTHERVWLMLLEGVLGIIAGIVTFAWPGLTGLVLLYFIAAWAIVTGIIEVISAVRLRNHVAHEWSWIIGGVLSVVFGILLLAQPGAGALAVAWLVGIYAVLFGVSMILVAWRVYELEQSEHGHPGSEGLHQPIAP